MKTTFFSAVLAIFAATTAYASDGGIYTETTETYTEQFAFNYNYDVPAYENTYVVVRPVAQPRPCQQRAASSIDVRPCPRAAAPVRVKTHTEVIDHYQVYQPVTIYQPAGTYSERRIIDAPRPCNRCNG